MPPPLSQPPQATKTTDAPAVDKNLRRSMVGMIVILFHRVAGIGNDLMEILNLTQSGVKDAKDSERRGRCASGQPGQQGADARKQHLDGNGRQDDPHDAGHDDAHFGGHQAANRGRKIQHDE